MNITNTITDGMTPQEKEIYFAHMEKRHREEREKLDAEKARLNAYKQSLIEEILEKHPEFTYEALIKKTTRVLEYMA